MVNKHALVQNKKKLLFIIAFGLIVLMNFVSSFFTAISDIMLILSVLLFVTTCVIFDFQKNFCILLFLISFQVYDIKCIDLSYFNLICSFFVAVISIKYAILCFTKKTKIHYIPFIFTIIICLYSFVNLDMSQIYYAFANMVLFVLIYLTYSYAKELNKKELCKYFILGIIVSTLFAFILYLIPETQQIVMLGQRFRGISRHPNTLQILCVIAISILISLYFKNNISKFHMLSLVVYFCGIGILTMSKSFIVCFAILTLVYFILMFRKNKKQAWKELGIFVVVAFLLLFIFFDKFKSIFERFFKYGYDNILDNILTGRFTLWKKYLSYWAGSVFTIIFGCGVSHKQPFALGPHSGYIDIIYKFGILGTLLICGLIYSYLRETQNKKERFSFANFIPLLMFLIISIEEYLFSSMRCVFVLCVLILLDVSNNKINEQKNRCGEISERLKFVKFKDIVSIFGLIIAFIPAMITKLFIRDFWLVCEDENEARDNGYWFFKYIRENHLEQKIAYAIDKKANDYNKVKHLGKIISYGTIEHWFWYIVADKNISSQKGGKPNAAVCYFFEVVLKLRKKNRVFLQHGITINDAKFLYYTNTYINKFITATIPETEFIKEKFGYPEENICLAGFCRFDNLNDFEVDNNQILVMPTWRQWIAKGVEMKKIEGSDNFIESNYFKNWSEFLNNDSLKNLLKKHNKKLVFYPHRNMQKYLSYFTTDCENIVIANSKENDVQELLKKSAVLITDYSSVFFDFAYMKKPLIFYQFDEEIFRNYQYEKGYFDYKNNGFSMWTKDSQSLIKYLESVIDNNMQFTKETTIDRYFPFKDNKNCERNYLAIKNGANKFTKEKEHDS